MNLFEIYGVSFVKNPALWRYFTRNIKYLIFYSAVLGFLGTISCDGDTDRVSDVSDDKTLEEFVKHAAARLSEAATFSETLATLNAFRETGEWNNGSTYLVLLTSGGGVYVHARNRELEDQDWSELQDAAGNNVGQQLLSGGFVSYVGEDNMTRKAYAFPFFASAVPFANTRGPQGSQFVLVGGFDYEPEVKSQKRFYEELLDSLPAERHPHPLRKAREIGRAEKEDGKKKTEEERKQELKMFVEEAVQYFAGSVYDTNFNIDPVILRAVFRLDNGPWRYISTYIYIMDDEGNVIFNGANRNIEHTNLLEDPDVGEDIARLIAAAKMPGGGFVNYDWDDPAVMGDEPQGGSAGGGSPKLGYTKLHSFDKDDPSASVYIFGSGIYLGSSEQ